MSYSFSTLLWHSKSPKRTKTFILREYAWVLTNKWWKWWWKRGVTWSKVLKMIHFWQLRAMCSVASSAKCGYNNQKQRLQHLNIRTRKQWNRYRILPPIPIALARLQYLNIRKNIRRPSYKSRVTASFNRVSSFSKSYKTGLLLALTPFLAFRAWNHTKRGYF